MNDPGLDGPIQDSANEAERILHEKAASDADLDDRSSGARQAIREELQNADDKKQKQEAMYNQPKRWWFTSTAFPLIAGTFGPLANLLSVCALVQTWRVTIPPGGVAIHGERVPDPSWLIAINAVSLAFAVIANLCLLLNFAHRISYRVAQPITITVWYISSFLLIALVAAASQHLRLDPRNHAFSQAYYYAIISATMYFIISTLLLFNWLGAHLKAYPATFDTLTIPQRTLMLQTVSYTFYLALGAGVFASVEGWEFEDAIYWANYTLFTIGLGTDFPLRTATGRGLLIPFAALGIIMLGLVIGSIRSLVLERGKTKVSNRAIEKERLKAIEKREVPSTKDAAWRKQEFYKMREIQDRADRSRKLWSLTNAVIAFLFIWLGGAMVFTFTERVQHWNYFESLYFSYTSLLTIGYGDFYPQSNSGKPFFVIWSLVSVPTMTVLISNMGDTVVDWVKEGTLWIGERTILPEQHLTGRGPQALKRKAMKEDTKPREGTAGDLEKIGATLEKTAQREVDRGDSIPISRPELAAAVAREIKNVARDIGAKPPKRYEWEEWSRWMELLGKVDRDGNGDENAREENEFEWTWLGKDGPLHAGVTETEWVLGQLCGRLQELVVEKEEEDEKESER